MPKFKKDSDEKHENSERWLLTYSDMITLLLALFIMMYTMSTIDSKKFQALAQQMGVVLGKETEAIQTGGGSTGTGNVTIPGAKNTAPVKKDEFQKAYEIIKANLNKKGLNDKVTIEKGDYYILIRFKDSVLFYPDSPNIKSEGYEILEYISTTLKSANSVIEHIQIDGHTAKVSDENNSNMFAWKLSSDRAIGVLKILSMQNGLPQSKMSIAGYSHYVPVSSNDSEEGKASNRRVEIKITKTPN